jgi:esterase/lipase superfamily enzyme
LITWFGNLKLLKVEGLSMKSWMPVKSPDVSQAEKYAAKFRFIHKENSLQGSSK